MQLEVELEAGDALVGAGDFAIHVAEGILPADDVGEQFVILDFAAVVGTRAEADADAGDGALQRDTRVKQCQRAAADGGHRRGAVGLHDLRRDANRVREVLDVRYDRSDGTLGQCAVTNLAASRAHDAAGFADGEMREVVVQHEPLLARAAGVGVVRLRVIGRAERDERQALCLAPGEQAGAVCAGDHAGLAGELAHVVVAAAVKPLAVVKHELAYGRLLDCVKRLADHEAGDGFRAEFLGELLRHLILERVARGLALELGLNEQRVGDAIRNDRLRLRHNVRRDHSRDELALGFANCSAQFILRSDERSDRLLAELQRLEKIGFRDFIGCALEHDHVRLVADVNQIEVA